MPIYCVCLEPLVDDRVEKERKRDLYLCASRHLKLMTHSVLHEFMQSYLKDVSLL